MIDVLIILPMVLFLVCSCLWNAFCKMRKYVGVKNLEISAYREEMAQRDAYISDLLTRLRENQPC